MVPAVTDVRRAQPWHIHRSSPVRQNSVPWHAGQMNPCGQRRSPGSPGTLRRAGTPRRCAFPPRTSRSARVAGLDIARWRSLLDHREQARRSTRGHALAAARVTPDTRVVTDLQDRVRTCSAPTVTWCSAPCSPTARPACRRSTSPPTARTLLLGLVARGPALAEHRPRLPGRAGRLRLQPAARGDCRGLCDRDGRGGAGRRARDGVRHGVRARRRGRPGVRGGGASAAMPTSGSTARPRRRSRCTSAAVTRRTAPASTAVWSCRRAESADRMTG